MEGSELCKVSLSCSEAVDSSASNNNGDFSEESGLAYDPRLPWLSSDPVCVGIYSTGFSSGAESDDSSDNSYSNLSRESLAM